MGALEKYKIFSWFRKYPKVSIGIVLFLLVFILIKCGIDTVKRSQCLAQTSEEVLLRQHLIDSMSTVQHNSEIVFQQKVQKEAKLVIDKALSKANSFKEQAETFRVKGNKLQSNLTNLKSRYKFVNAYVDSLMTAYQDRLDTLGLERDALNEEINELNIVITQDSIGWEACKKECLQRDSLYLISQESNKIKDNVIKDFQKQVNSNNTWLKKNTPFLVGLLSFIGGILVAK